MTDRIKDVDFIASTYKWPDRGLFQTGQMQIFLIGR